MSFADGPEGITPRPLTTTLESAAAVARLSRIEVYVLLEAVRAPKGVLELDGLDGPEEARFTAAKRLELDGLLRLVGPSMYQITRKGRDPRLLADVALQWIRRKP